MSVAKDETKATAKKGGALWDTVKVVVQALLLALVIRTFLFQPFSIPSGSMENTLLVGDYLFISKYAYGYSRYSLPFGLPLFDGRILASEPERGDIIVFKLPSDNETDYIKRLIGLPGDRIQVIDGQLYINGEPTQVEEVGTEDAGFLGQATIYRETLPNGVSYEIRDLGQSVADNTEEFVVPEGSYFFLGDNRDNSCDSRFSADDRRCPGGVGFVPFENLIGRAEIIFFSVEEGARVWEFWRWPSTVRADRLFQGL